MRRPTRFLLAASLAGSLGACTTAGLSDEGQETGPCIDGGCFGNSVCLSDLCVDPDDDDDDDDDDSGGETGGNSGPSSMSGETSPTTTSPTDTTPTDSSPTGDSDSSPTDDSNSSPTDDSDSSPTDDSDSSTTDDSESGGSSSTSDTGESSSTSDTGDTTESDTNDGPGAGDPCSVFLQNCNAGLKCNPWADDGGTSWNAARCVDIANNPGAPGQSCSVEGSGVSGIDDCELGAMCWNVDTESNAGTCVELCSGTPANPVCETAGATCSISNDGQLPLCLAGCDPLAQDCGLNEGCYQSGETFVCAPDASGATGAFGDFCEFVNVCDPGLSCIFAEFVPGCLGAACCSPFCSISNPTCPAEMQCAATETTVPGSEDVGVCTI